MADFFLDEPVAQQPVAASDPAADFLATEQAELDRDGHFMIFEKLAFFFCNKLYKFAILKWKKFFSFFFNYTKLT